MEPKGSLFLRSNHMNYGKEVFVSNWYVLVLTVDAVSISRDISSPWHRNHDFSPISDMMSEYPIKGVKWGYGLASSPP